MANRPGTSDELMQEEKLKGTIKIGKKTFNRAELLKDLTILEVSISRNANSIDQSLKLMFDYGTMQFSDYKEYIADYKKPKKGKVVEKTSKFEPNKTEIKMRTDNSSVFDNDIEDATIIEDKAIAEKIPVIEEKINQPKGNTIIIPSKGDELPF
jgi:ribosomal protein S16